MSQPSVHPGKYLHVRQRDTDGRATVFAYRVWNDTIAVNALDQACRSLNAEALKKGQPAQAGIEVISEETYLRERTR